MPRKRWDRKCKEFHPRSVLLHEVDPAGKKRKHLVTSEGNLLKVPVLLDLLLLASFESSW